MKHLASIRANVLYTKEKGEYKKINEIVLLSDGPEYKYSNEGEIVRQRSLQEHRFLVDNAGIDNLIAVLEKIKEVENEDLE